MVGTQLLRPGSYEGSPVEQTGATVFPFPPPGWLVCSKIYAGEGGIAFFLCKWVPFPMPQARST